MEQMVNEATQAILPFLGAGAGAAAQGFAEGTGASLSDAAARVIERIRTRLAGRTVTQPNVAEVLQDALGAGDLTEPEVQSFVVEVGRTQVLQGAQISQQAEKIYNGDITAEVFNG
jgi:hypothetical protein